MVRLFRVFVPTSVVTLLISEVVLIFGCFFFLTWILFPADFDIFLLYDNGIERIAIVVLVFVLTLYYQDLYTRLRIRSKVLLLQMILMTVGISLIAQAALAYVSPDLTLPRVLMIAGATLTLIVLFAWRVAYSKGIFRAWGMQRVLFLGTSGVSVSAAEHIAEHPQFGLLSIGFLEDRKEPGTILEGGPVLGPVAHLRGIADEYRPDRIVVGMTERRNHLPMHDLLDLRFRGVRIQEAANLYETIFGRVPITELRPSQLIYTAELGPLPGSMRVQTIYSMAIAIVCFIVALPVLALVALAVKLTSPGPILFRQKRVGLNGVPFTLYKFRSMVTDAEAKTGAVWAKRNDPRVTPIGRYLRKLRLDELPQLINVLRGEMSIVGPRPERPEFVNVLSEQIPFYRQRHAVRPGVTGWAQINYKYGETIEDTMMKLEYDLYYIKNLSPALDFYIIFHTLKVMLFTQSGQ
jgi:sugar transferase (PEP-CTERM system associated)